MKDEGCWMILIIFLRVRYQICSPADVICPYYDFLELCVFAFWPMWKQVILHFLIYIL